MNLDRTFAALSHTKRRPIVARLVRGDATVAELAKPLGLRREALASAAEWIDFHRTFWSVNFAMHTGTG
jgi:hypothetical protein